MLATRFWRLELHGTSFSHATHHFIPSHHQPIKSSCARASLLRQCLLLVMVSKRRDRFGQASGKTTSNEVGLLPPIAACVQRQAFQEKSWSAQMLNVQQQGADSPDAVMTLYLWIPLPVADCGRDGWSKLLGAPLATSRIPSVCPPYHSLLQQSTRRRIVG